MSYSQPLCGDILIHPGGYSLIRLACTGLIQGDRPLSVALPTAETPSSWYFDLPFCFAPDGKRALPAGATLEKQGSSQIPCKLLFAAN